MLAQISEALRARIGLFARPELSVEERYRRGYLALCFLIVIPALAGYAVVDLVKERLSEALLTFALVSALVVIFALIPRWQEIWALFRVAVALAVSVLAYAMSTGAGGDLAFLWFYTVPLIVFFLFGKAEGAVWVSASCVVLLVFFFSSFGSQPYDATVAIRFMTTYVVVSVLAYGIEASRQRYYGELLAEKAHLEDALAHAKILRGLLPICASCKSVRDDQGYWNRIETYVQQHSEARFSEETCPECQRAEPQADLPRRSRVSG